MDFVKAYGKEEIQKLTRKRNLEEKVGEFILHAENNWRDDLKNSSCRFVLLGIPEDIGVRGNQGRAGASTAVRPALESFLNQQNNSFIDPSSIFLLGEVFVDDLMDKAKDLDQKKNADLLTLRNLVEEIDQRVAEVISFIVLEKKIPIVIGGGHNNAYGNIKGGSRALGEKINVINCDPHLDFRPTEGRHSGNGFSYAYGDGLMKKYSVLCMHEQYNNFASIEQFRQHPQDLYFSSYESVFVREESDFKTALKNCIGFVKDLPCGVELDLDAITNVPSSAKTSSGITALQARQYVYQCALNLETIYLHIAEGAPVLSHIKADNKTGKLISYLITDFIKGCMRADHP